jgi:tetratricopeptide (TPR) repeat protein
MGLSDTLRNIEAEIAAGHPEQALSLCLELQTRYPRALAVQRVLGEAYLALRKPREALGALDRALAGNPEDARACCARAIVQQIHGDAISALKWYRRACDITPDDQVLRSAYRELAASQGQPAYRPTRMGLARLYLRGDLFSHAIREWESLLAEEPDSLEAQVGLAETLWRARHFQAAVDHSERILVNSPSCVKAMMILAIIAHEEGRVEEAQRLVRRTADLDPDCRIGQALCADRLAAGDRALRLLLLGEEASAGREAVSSRPLAAAPRSQPLPEPTVLRSGASRSQPLGGATAIPQAPQPQPTQPQLPQRGNNLPANFRSIFAETEYMLWGRETDELGAVSPTSPVSSPMSQMPQAAQAAQAAPLSQPPQMPQMPQMPQPQGGMPPTTGSLRDDQFARSNVFVPPVLRDQDANLDETETRTSINFVNWLQAQGALQEGQYGAPLQRAPLSRPLAPQPVPPAPAQMPAWGNPAGQTGQTGQQQILPMAQQPLPPMSPMSPAPQQTQQAQAQTQQAQQTRQTRPVPQLTEEMETGPLPPPTSEDLRQMFAELEPETGRQRVAEAAVAMTNAGPSVADRRREADSEVPVLTPQALEEQFTGSGFHEADTSATASSLEADTSAAGAYAAFANDHQRAEPATPPEPELLVPAEEPEPADYPARLERARQRREAGQMDDALNDYRLILKNAPDLLGDVVDDLNESLEEAPDHPELHRLLGDAHIRQGNYLQALEAYNRAVALTQAQNG